MPSQQIQQQIPQFSSPQPIPQQPVQTNQTDFVAAALYQQQQQLQQQQQQFQIQQQLQQQQQQMLNTNQLALYKPVVQQIIPAQPLPQQQTIPAQDEISQQRQQTILLKLDTINEKLEQLKSIQQQSNNTPTVVNMETGILLSNLQRIIKENEQYKKDLYEKSVKIEDLNGRITELLARNQSFVEKSHMLLEQKNTSYGESSEKTVLRILELEQDKMKLTQDLTNLTSKISDLNIQINKQNMTEFELKQRFNEISKSYDTEKNEIERLKLDNLEHKSKLEALNEEFKKERQHKKQIELEFARVKEERHELKDEISNYEKLLNEKRAKYDADKKQFELDMDEVKQQFTSEIKELKEKLTKYRNNTNEINKEQSKQLEADLTNEWKIKLEKALKLQEQKYERSSAELNEEKNNLTKQLASINEQFKLQREKLNQTEIANEELQERVDELNIVEEKFKRLQSQALIMKERYETRIKELMDAEPDSEVLNEYVKKCMNSIYQKLKLQVNLKNNYSGEGVLTGMLKLIKFFTIQIMQSKESESDEEAADYFSEYIVDFDEKLDDQKNEYENKIDKLKEEFSTKQQLMVLQHEAQLNGMESKVEALIKEVNEAKNEVQVLSIPKVETIVKEVVVDQKQAIVENIIKDEKILECNNGETFELSADTIEVTAEIKNDVKEELSFEQEHVPQPEEKVNVTKEIIEEKETVITESTETDKKELVNQNIVDEQNVLSDDNQQKELIEPQSDDNYKSIYDVPADANFEIEETSTNDKKPIDNGDEDDDDFLLKPKPPSIDSNVNNQAPKKNALFDDDDDDDDIFLFSKATKASNSSETKTTKIEPDNEKKSNVRIFYFLIKKLHYQINKSTFPSLRFQLRIYLNHHHSVMTTTVTKMILNGLNRKIFKN